MQANGSNVVGFNPCVHPNGRCSKQVLKEKGLTYLAAQITSGSSRQDSPFFQTNVSE